MSHRQGKDWRQVIEFAMRAHRPFCPGDLQCVVSELLEVVHVLGEANEALEKRVRELEEKPTRPTSYERILGQSG